MEDKTQSLIHVLKCVSKGLSDIINVLGNVRTITSELQTQIQDAVERLDTTKQARPEASGQSLNSYVSQASHPGYVSSLERSHQDQPQLSSKSNHFKKNPQTNKSNAEHIKRPNYPKSEFDRVSSRDVGQNLSLGNRISSAYQTPISSLDEKTYKQQKSQQNRPHVFSFQKKQTDQLLKSHNMEKEKNIKTYEPLRAVKQFPPKFQPISLDDVISERESLPKGQYAVQARDFISFAERTLEQMNTTHGVLSTEIEIVAYIQSEASQLSNRTQEKDNRSRLSDLNSRFQRFLKNRFNKTN